MKLICAKKHIPMADSQKKEKFNCKYADCLYSEGSRLYFQKYRYLKQHYDKVHNTKIYECTKCLKKFGTTTLQKSHMSYCGKEFKCSCGVVYKSNEALLTHAKRKRHPLGPLPRVIGIDSTNGKHIQSPNTAHSLSINFSAGSQFIILQSNSHDHLKSQSLTENSTQECSMHIMDAAVFSRLSAAVALSELALTSPSNQLPEKREVSTQTDSSIPDLWLNTVQEETSNLVSKIQDFGTQTEDVDFNVVLNPESPHSPCSPWLGLQAFSAETQTVDEDAVLRPFNLCNIQTQTPWNEISDDDDTTELAHTETQTLLSSFFIDDGNVPECQGERRMNSFLVKQNSEDAGTDPMEIFD
ncbi:uncharacterized protein LOC116916111 [Daphnia magna]|uniref:uncharacterized protein LOC116916111 n=1 Tax=Daphnia magna TaxID=35525 RepID=UPI001E1BCCC7|nr:uncharacterized protein LOC116916111 [Daphnia magna]